MKGIGSSYIASLRVARDFEKTEPISAFIAQRGRRGDVEPIGGSLLRLSQAGEDAVRDALHDTFARDVAKDLEGQVLAVAKGAIESLSPDVAIKPYFKFRWDGGAEKASARAIFACGSTALELDLFADAPAPSGGEVDRALERAPALYWLIDERSPFYSPDAIKNLKIYLAVEALEKAGLSDKDRAALKRLARQALRHEKGAAQEFPRELSAAARELSGLVKRLANAVAAEVEVVRHRIAVGVGIVEYQALVAVAGGPAPLTFALGERVGAGGEVQDAAWDSLPGAPGSAPWGGLFEPRKGSAKAPDEAAVKRILCACGYRIAKNRFEKLAMRMWECFPPFEGEVGSSGLEARFRHAVEIPVGDKEELWKATWAYRDNAIERLLAFCRAKRIALDGAAWFSSDGAGEKAAALPSWEIAGGAAEDRQSHVKFASSVKFEVELKLRIGERSDRRYIEVLGSYVADALGGPRRAP
jgi:hypothetical protein